MDKPTESHNLFPIRHIARETGVLPVTLRAWERRYGLLKPQRTEKGHRLYSADDLRKVRQIIALIDSGIPVGQVKSLLGNRSTSSARTSDWPGFRERVLKAAQALDGGAVIQALREAGGIYPLHLLAEEMIRPCLTSIAHSQHSARWAWQNTAAQAISLYLEQRSRGLEVDRSKAPILITALSPGEAGPGITARTFEIMSREAGIDARWIGAAPDLLACAETINGSKARGTVIWEDGEPLGEWAPELQRFSRAASCPFALAGDFALHHRKQLESMQIPLLPSDIHAATALIQNW